MLQLLETGTSYYSLLLERLGKANHSISMVYHAYSHGKWAERINTVLLAKAKEGCQVRLCVDGFGSIFETYTPLADHHMYRKLREGGVIVTIFWDKAFFKRHLHAKLTAIDETMAFFGGSNIADHYCQWTDTNFLLEGRLGDTFHKLYTLFSQQSLSNTRISSQRYSAAGGVVVAQISPYQLVFEEEILDLIQNAKEYFRAVTWYFWPSEKVILALIAAVERGVHVEIIYSYKNRFPLISFVNFFIIRRLRKAGIQLHAWTRGFNHSKLFWNERSSIVGSANLDRYEAGCLHELLYLCHEMSFIQTLNDRFTLFLQDSLLITRAN